MNLKWIQRIIIISLFAGNVCNASQIKLDKILGSNLDYFFIHPNNALFNEYKQSITSKPFQFSPNPAAKNAMLMCANYNTLLFTDASKLFSINVLTDQVKDMNINSAVQTIACSPDNSFIAASNGANIIIISTLTGKKYTGSMDTMITSLALSDFGLIAIGFSSGKIICSEIKDNVNALDLIPKKTFLNNNYAIQQLLFTSDSKNIIAICNSLSKNENKVIVNNNSSSKTIHASRNKIKKICISNADQYIAISDMVGTVNIYKNSGGSSYKSFVQINSHGQDLILTISFFDKLPYLIVSTPSKIKLINFYPYRNWYNYGTSFIFTPEITLNPSNSIDILNTPTLKDIVALESINNYLFIIINQNLMWGRLPSFYATLAEVAKNNIKQKTFKIFKGFYFNKERQLLIENNILNEKLPISDIRTLLLGADFARDTSISAQAPGWFTIRNAAIVGAIGAGAYTYYYLRSHPELLQKLTSGFSSTTAQAAESAQAAAPVVQEVIQKAPKVIAPPSPEMLEKMKRAVGGGINLFPPSK